MGKALEKTTIETMAQSDAGEKQKLDNDLVRVQGYRGHLGNFKGNDMILDEIIMNYLSLPWLCVGLVLALCWPCVGL